MLVLKVQSWGTARSSGMKPVRGKHKPRPNLSRANRLKALDRRQRLKVKDLMTLTIALYLGDR
jgi:hypothetical protein